MNWAGFMKSTATLRQADQLIDRERTSTLRTARFAQSAQVVAARGARHVSGRDDSRPAAEPGKREAQHEQWYEQHEPHAADSAIARDGVDREHQGIGDVEREQ